MSDLLLYELISHKRVMSCLSAEENIVYNSVLP